MERKILIGGKEFYVIPECVQNEHVLCIAAEPWGKGIWGSGENGQVILDIADNRNPCSLTYEWYQLLPSNLQENMLTMYVTTDDVNCEGKGELEQTEMFVLSWTEWKKGVICVSKALHRLSVLESFILQRR